MSENIISNFERDIYKKYYPLVYSNCKRRLSDHATIEDAIQSTFLMYIREEKTIQSQLSSWLYWTSTNVCKVLNKDIKINKKIAEQQHQEQFSNEGNLSSQNDEIQIQLKNILEKLPKKKQDMLLMRFFDGMSYRQIGLHFKSSEDGVRKMIEHTLNGLKEKLNKKDIAFSILFEQFFQSSAKVENTLLNIGTKTQGFILQNTIKQQFIVNSVYKMILFSKIKLAMVMVVCVSIPVSAIIFANTGNINEQLINKAQNITINNNEKKDIVAEKIDKKSSVVEPVSKSIEPTVVKPIEPEKPNFIGNWKLKSKTNNYPHQIGSVLTINKDGTFALTQPNAIGTYTSKDDKFTFDFSGMMIFPFTYTLTEKKLSFALKTEKGIMTMEYVREEK